MSDAAIPQTPVDPGPSISYQIHPSIAYEDQLLTRERAATWLGIHADTLGIWERQKRGPKVTRVGRTKIRYRLGDILQWLLSQRDAAPEGRRKGKYPFRHEPTVQSAARLRAKKQESKTSEASLG